jgi:hypothetical protein
VTIRSFIKPPSVPADQVLWLQQLRQRHAQLVLQRNVHLIARALLSAGLAPESVLGEWGLNGAPAVLFSALSSTDRAMEVMSSSALGSIVAAVRSVSSLSLWMRALWR